MNGGPIYLPAVPLTTEGLRDALFDEINGLRNGTTTLQRAKAIAQMAARIIDSIRVQVQYQKIILESKKEKVTLGSAE